MLAPERQREQLPRRCNPVVSCEPPCRVERYGLSDRVEKLSRRGASPLQENVVTLSPLLNAGSAIQVHAFAAMSAFALGVVQLSAPKGTLPHRIVGGIWVLLMLIVSISAFFIHELRLWGPWSPIHLLAIFTLVMLPIAVLRAHRHDVMRHRRAMLGLFLGGLVIAGLFTLLPGRIMHAVVFGD